MFFKIYKILKNVYKNLKNIKKFLLNIKNGQFQLMCKPKMPEKFPSITPKKHIIKGEKKQK